MMRYFCILFVFMLAACNPILDREFRQGGAGLQLKNDLTVANTTNLAGYFQELCAQAGYSVKPTNCAPTPTTNNAATWKLLVDTGYNDIDYRCNRYLSWIDSKRTERIFVNGASTSAGTFLAGALSTAGAGANALTYVALSLGLIESLYDDYHNSLLLGLEGSTIKDVVKKRRNLHRQKFAGRRYENRADAVYALSRYLTFCTPQDILTAVNTFSRDAASGRTTSALTEAEEAAALLAPTSNDKAGPGTVRNREALPKCEEFFEPASNMPCNEALIRQFQQWTCAPSVDGKIGGQTKEAIRILKLTIPSMSDGDKITSDDFAKIDETVCPPGILNYFEKTCVAKDGGAQLMARWAADTEIAAIGSDLEAKPLSAVRSAIAKLREDVKLTEPSRLTTNADKAAFLTQVTPALFQRVDVSYFNFLIASNCGVK